MAIDVSVQKRWGDFSLDVSFSSPGGIVGLLGASGCGKSKTLQSIAGIEKPDKGHISVNDRILFDASKSIDVPVQKRRVGYLFQDYALFPDMTVKENIFYCIRKKAGKEEKREIIKSVVESLHLTGLEERKPGQLSGGQQQRVALARILVNEPDVLLLDEPFSALDSYLKERLVIELKEALARFQKDVVLVTHSRDEAYQLCDRVAVLSAGKIEVFGKTREVFTRPQTVTAAVLTSCKNIADAEKRGSHDVFVPSWNIVLHTEDEVQDGLCAVGVRAHSFSSQRNENEQPIVVTECVEQPFEWVIKFRYANQCVDSEDLWWRFPKEHFPSSMPSQLGVRREDVLPLYK